MKRTGLALTLATLALMTACNSGSRSSRATAVAPVSSGATAAQTTSSSTTTPVQTQTTTTTVAWDTAFTANPAIQNDSLIALHSLGNGQILAGSPLGTVRLIDLANGTDTSEGSYGSVSSFADVGGQVFVGTGQPFFMQGGQGEVFLRDAQGNYTVSFDHSSATATTVTVLGTEVYAFGSDYGTGADASVNLLGGNNRAWQADVVALPACQINKAVAWRNAVWAVGSDNALNGTLRLFFGTGANFTEVTGLPDSRPGTLTNELEIPTDLRVIQGELYLATAVVDPAAGSVVTGAIYKSFDGTAWSVVATTPRDAPMAIVHHQGQLFAGLISGEVQALDATTQTLAADAGVPTSTGVMSMLELDADTLLVGVRAAAGAELLRRVTSTAATTGSGTTGTTPTPPAVTYTADVKPVLQARCAACHGNTSNAAYTLYPLTFSNDAQDHSETVNRVDLNMPDASLLLTKARGMAHGGGAVIAAGSAEHTTLINWIQGGAVR